MIILFAWEEDAGDVSNNLTKFFKFQASSNTNSGKSEQGESGRVDHFRYKLDPSNVFNKQSHSFLLEIFSIEFIEKHPSSCYDKLWGR